MTRVCVGTRREKTLGGGGGGGGKCNMRVEAKTHVAKTVCERLVCVFCVWGGGKALE